MKSYSNSISKDQSPTDGMKFAATGRAGRLAWIKRSGIELRYKAKIRIGGGQHRRRHHSTSKHGTWPI